MPNKKIYFLALIFIVILNLFFSSAALAIPDSSAVYCGDSGYKYEIRKDAEGGEYGVCVFPDGTECDTWQYYCKCQPQGTGCWQDNFICAFPCKELPCKKAGEGALVSECCEGLREIPPVRIYDDECKETGMTGWTFICSDCGNKICENWENTCNCPSDCAAIKHKNYSTIYYALGVGLLIFIFVIYFFLFKKRKKL